MGICCQINLLKPPNIAFAPGEVVSGVIKYAVHDSMEFEKITTSLKGSGQLSIRVKSSQRNRDTTYTAKESYVDIDHIVRDEKFQVPVGCYEIKFNFQIPENVPSSLSYTKNFNQYTVRCRIKYYIRIKFERPGWFAFTKHFRKEINVESGITPNLLMEPVIYGEWKNLMRLFSRKNAIVSIKASIMNSVIPAGGTVFVNYEIKNDSNVVIKSIETKLVEMFTFKANGHKEVKAYEDVHDTDSKTGSINCDMIEHMPLELTVPMGRFSLQNSKLVARDYLVRIIAELPMPHRNVVLDIPIQVGRFPQGAVLGTENVGEPIACAMTYDDPPPSYWEVMGEAAKGDGFDDDCDDHSFKKGEKS
ncbi:uncharacterized protein LOC142975230 [Anticarsia gemmatalis]|uniref:uncharacterized protein LOC142975230 n=1 Tax=Anticarsia gemmatalis TaxID=129554 RepID=UPI003F776C88